MCWIASSLAGGFGHVYAEFVMPWLVRLAVVSRLCWRWDSDLWYGCWISQYICERCRLLPSEDCVACWALVFFSRGGSWMCCIASIPLPIGGGWSLLHRSIAGYPKHLRSVCCLRYTEWWGLIWFLVSLRLINIGLWSTLIADFADLGGLADLICCSSDVLIRRWIFC